MAKDDTDYSRGRPQAGQIYDPEARRKALREPTKASTPYVPNHERTGQQAAPSGRSTSSPNRITRLGKGLLRKAEKALSPGRRRQQVDDAVDEASGRRK